MDNEGIKILDRVEGFYENDRDMMETHLKTNQEIEKQGLRTEATHYEGENTEGQIKLRNKQLEEIKDVKQGFVEAQKTLIDTDSNAFDATSKSSATKETTYIENVDNTDSESNGRAAK